MPILILKHSDISSSTVSQEAYAACGSWTNFKQSTTWNVNLAKLVGSDYARTDKFKLRLASFSHGAADFANAPIDQDVVFRLSGPNFINSTYDVRSRTNNRHFDMFLAHINTDESKTYYLQDESMALFTKGGDTVQFTVDIRRLLDGAAVEIGSEPIPHMSFILHIDPIIEG